MFTLDVWKRPIGCCCLAQLLSVVDKDSFDSSEAGLFTSNDANEAEVCAILFVETSKRRRSRADGLTDEMKVLDSVLVRFADRTAGRTLR